ncbi:MAG: DUF432 domain-containing protein [Desulfurococcales archaeon]|nr:DUF432 domain-containing protein [Desulfurococcales archaeon]
MVYGAIRSNTEVRLGPYIISIDDSNELILYRRLQGDTTVSSTVIKSAEPPILHPITPTNLPEPGLYEHFMVQLDKPIALDPDERMEFDVYLPVDLAVTLVAGEDGVRHIDIFSLTTPKMAVYGTVREGVIARFLKPGRPGPGMAVMRISIKNEHEAPVLVRRIVGPLRALKVYYKDGTWDARYSSVRVEVKSPRVAEVEVEEADPPSGFRRAPTQKVGFTLSRIAGVAYQALTPISTAIERRYTMSWGY